MRSVKGYLALIVYLGLATATQAADLNGAASETMAGAIQPARLFYVRGDIGIGRNAISGFSQRELSDNGGSFISKSIGDSPYISAGLGWQLSRRFRLDLTGEYRSTAQIRAMDNLSVQLTGPDGTLQANTLYQGNLSSYVGLLNGYWDLVNWRGFTPYVGAGVGFARHTVSGVTTTSSATFTDAGTGILSTQLTNGFSDTHSQTNFAWALMAGTSYDLSPNSKLDLGYRYINLGSGIAASTSLIDCTCGTVGSPLKLRELEAHEFRIGIRWQLGATEAAYNHPLK